MNSNSDLSWVERAESAIAADPHLTFEKRDDRQVVVRAESGPGNTLDYKVTFRRGEPPTVQFGRDQESFRIGISVSATMGRPGATQILIEALDEGKPLNPGEVSKVNLRKLLAEVNEQLQAPWLRYQLQRDGNTYWSDPFLAMPKPGRRGRPDIDYAVWADRYVDANRRSGGKPMPYLTERFPGYSTDSLRAILNKARRRGLLSAAESGKAGGHLLPKATELLLSQGLPITSLEED